MLYNPCQGSQQALVWLQVKQDLCQFQQNFQVIWYLSLKVRWDFQDPKVSSMLWTGNNPAALLENSRTNEHGSDSPFGWFSVQGVEGRWNPAVHSKLRQWELSSRRQTLESRVSACEPKALTYSLAKETGRLWGFISVDTENPIYIFLVLGNMPQVVAAAAALSSPSLEGESRQVKSKIIYKDAAQGCRLSVPGVGINSRRKSKRVDLLSFASPSASEKQPQQNPLAAPQSASSVLVYGLPISRPLQLTSSFRTKREFSLPTWITR